MFLGVISHLPRVKAFIILPGVVQGALRETGEAWGRAWSWGIDREAKIPLGVAGVSWGKRIIPRGVAGGILTLPGQTGVAWGV